MPRAALHQLLVASSGRAAVTASAGAVPQPAAAAVAAFFLFCVLVLALAGCASHGSWWQRRRCVGRGWRSEPVISIQQVQPGGAEEEAAYCSVWQKSIIMGGKCQLPEFSGVINYDSAGNLVVPGRPRAAVLAIMGRLKFAHRLEYQVLV